MAAPIGTCYPPSTLPNSFSRDIKIRIGIFLQRKAYKKYTNECFPEQNDAAWVLVREFPWYQADVLVFNFTLNFNINPNFQLGDDLRTYYICMNIDSYSQAFAAKEAEANQIGATLALREARSIPDTRNTCTKCDGGVQTQGRTVREQKIECDSKVAVIQTLATGCTTN